METDTADRQGGNEPGVVPGTAPGTLTIDPAAPKPVVEILAYGPEDVVEKRLESPAKGMVKAEVGGTPAKLSLSRNSTFSAGARRKQRKGKHIV